MASSAEEQWIVNKSCMNSKADDFPVYNYANDNLSLNNYTLKSFYEWKVFKRFNKKLFLFFLHPEKLSNCFAFISIPVHLHKLLPSH